jgi:hypothetical protein
MTTDRTPENRDAVLEFLESELDTPIRIHDAGNLEGVYFVADQLGGIRLQIGENFLADCETDDLIERLKRKRIIGYLKNGQSVSMFGDSTAVVP